MPIKSFRGLMADNTQDTIVLHTNDGSVGYKIVKFELMPSNPGGAAGEHVVQIWKVSQTANSNDIDFSNNILLGAGYASNATSGDSEPTRQSVIFDSEVFNQDIYVTHKIQNGSGSINYYIELEQVKLDLSENTVATLKDIRNIERDSTVTIP